MRLRVVSGSLAEVSIPRNSSAASGRRWKYRSMPRRFCVTVRRAAGWISRPWLWAAWKSRSISSGSASNALSSRSLIQPPLGNEGADVAVAREQPGKREQRSAAVFLLDGGTEYAGQGADVLGDQVVVLHEPFDGARADALVVAEPFRHQRLQVEGQPVVPAPFR